MYKQYNHESCTIISFVYKCKSEQVHLHCTLYNAHTPVLCVFPIHIYIITYTRDRALGMPPLSYFLTFIPCLMHNPVQLLTTMYWLVLICTHPIYGQFTLLVYISYTRDKKANFFKFLLHLEYFESCTRVNNHVRLCATMYNHVHVYAHVQECMPMYTPYLWTFSPMPLFFYILWNRTSGLFIVLVHWVEYKTNMETKMSNLNWM